MKLPKEGKEQMKHADYPIGSFYIIKSLLCWNEYIAISHEERQRTVEALEKGDMTAFLCKSHLRCVIPRCCCHGQGYRKIYIACLVYDLQRQSIHIVWYHRTWNWWIAFICLLCASLLFPYFMSRASWCCVAIVTAMTIYLKLLYASIVSILFRKLPWTCPKAN